jgi:triacylglycerol esterase/lipase EstA (alpha/beta hydrolase family)
MLVGHSVGGIVAKAAVLLSNHPSCAVRDIVQLSTPNVR